MARTLLRYFAVLTLFLMYLICEAFGQGIPSEKESLKGIKALRVVVEDLKPDIEKDGVLKRIIHTDVELKLRMAGIKVIDIPNLKEGNSFLYVNANILKSNNDTFYTYNISVNLKQDVFLARNNKLCFGAITWNSGSIGIIGKGELPEIRQDIKDHIDVFINDYLEMNPKD